MSDSPELEVIADDHYEMLSDATRMKAYQQAIERVVQPGDVVIDLGTGMGILALMAARAGARRVYAIEARDSIHIAQRVAAHNGYGGVIAFLHGNSQATNLPERADVLISETLGSFGFDENTVEHVNDIRERLLKPDARLLPRRLKTWIVPVHSPGAATYQQFWKNIAGFDFSVAREQSAEVIGVAKVKVDEFIGSPALLTDIDLADGKSPQIGRLLHFIGERDEEVHGLAGWFEAELCDDLILSTHPQAPATHWQQAYLALTEPLPVRAGDKIEVMLKSRPQGWERDDAQIEWDCRIVG
ncbi:MAG: 50S ribosomal protein L11 methyltransferase [Polyangiaceae bacterium]|nr:50S ribosomal protein L11 methyltransferase [Polyangiaceae bacterium]